MTPIYRFSPRPKSTLFNHLAQYHIILVTGPHRAGTTIAAAMIANDFGYYFFEDQQSQLEFLPGSPHIIGNAVFHCPSYCHYVHQLAHIPHLAVVMIVRDIEDIIASQERIPWAFEPQQLGFYRKAIPRPNFAVQPPIATVKYRYWQEVQKPTLAPNGYEIRYEDLSKHPMWVDREGRRKFTTANQLEIGKPHGPKVQGVKLPMGIAGNVVKND